MTLDEALGSFKLADTMLLLMDKSEVDEVLDILMYGVRCVNSSSIETLSDVLRDTEVNIKHVKYLYLLGLVETAEFLCTEYITVDEE